MQTGGRVSTTWWAEPTCVCFDIQAVHHSGTWCLERHSVPAQVHAAYTMCMHDGAQHHKPEPCCMLVTRLVVCLRLKDALAFGASQMQLFNPLFHKILSVKQLAVCLSACARTMVSCLLSDDDTTLHDASRIQSLQKQVMVGIYAASGVPACNCQQAAW